MGKLVRLADLPRLRRAASAAGHTIALDNGIFDLFHVGHLRYLEGARALADELVVAVNTDRSTRRNKGPGRPVVPEAERAEIVAGLACVDHVVLFGSRDVVPVIRALRVQAGFLASDDAIKEAAHRPCVREVRAALGRRQDCPEPLLEPRGQVGVARHCPAS